MPQPKQELTQIQVRVPQRLVNAAQQVAWALEIEQREAIRLALAMGLERLGAMFEPSPEDVIVKRGRPPENPES